MSALSRFLMAIAIGCVVTGSTVSILAIWGVIDDSTVVWRSLSTMGVVLLGAMACGVILGIFGRSGE